MPCKMNEAKSNVVDNSLLNTTNSSRNLGFIFDEHLTFSDQISSLSKVLLFLYLWLTLLNILLSHWLKMNERIEYKILSLTYKVLATSQHGYLHNLISVQSSDRTRSSLP